jgi:hypothetical protein
VIVSECVNECSGPKPAWFLFKGEKIMGTLEWVILILVLLFLFGGGGYYWSRGRG